MGADWTLLGALLAAATCAACIVPPEIEVSGNYPPTIDLTVVNDPPPYERGEYRLENCTKWEFRLPRIAIHDKNSRDQHFVRFFLSDSEAANGWATVTELEAAGLITAQIDPRNLPPYERFVTNRLTLYAKITDRDWPSTDDPLLTAPGATWTGLFWVIEVSENGRCDGL